ncbi:hypothetical protein B0H19DRAFT_1377172 [Mycena capillaripes]|nr:hypothetical protein B0H19DRAFT_1377172 [Mycena capillaripes]
MVADSKWTSNAEDIDAKPSDGGGGTIAPPQLPDPTNPPLARNYDSALRDNLYSGIDGGSLPPPFPPMQFNMPTAWPFAFNDSSHAPPFLKNSPIAPLPASINYYPETSNYGHAPNEARPRIDDLHDGTGVPPLQAATQQNAPPVLPFIAHGTGERFEDVWRWVTTGDERDAVALIRRIAYKHDLQVNIGPAPASVSSLPPQPFPNPSTIRTARTLPEFGGAGIGHSAEIPYAMGMSYAQMSNPYPIHSAAEQPQRFPGSSTTHPMTTRSQFGGHSAAVEIPNAHMNWLSSPSEPHCGPGHELQPFTREHDTSPSKKRRISKGGPCSLCTVADSPQWRRDPYTDLPLCNSCGQKEHNKKKKQAKERNGLVGRKLQQHR